MQYEELVKQRDYFENVNMIDKHSSKLTKGREKNSYINKIRNERGYIIIDSEQIQKIIRT